MNCHSNIASDSKNAPTTNTNVTILMASVLSPEYLNEGSPSNLNNMQHSTEFDAHSTEFDALAHLAHREAGVKESQEDWKDVLSPMGPQPNEPKSNDPPIGVMGVMGLGGGGILIIALVALVICTIKKKKSRNQKQLPQRSGNNVSGSLGGNNVSGSLGGNTDFGSLGGNTDHGSHGNQDLDQESHQFFRSLQTLAALNLQELKRDGATDEELMAARNSQFATNLYSKLAKKTPGNLVFSPFSIDSVLALLHYGSDGNTAKEMYDGLCYQSPEQALQNGHTAKKLKESLSKSWLDIEFKTCNALYVREDIEIKPEYSEKIKAFGSEVHQADFIPNGAAVINTWADEQTNGMIKELVNQESLTDYTTMVLTNGVYLDATWDKPFQELNTKPKEFSMSEGKTTSVSMMETEDYFKVYHDEKAKCTMLELKYQGGDLSMIVCLSDDKETTLESIQSALTTLDTQKMKDTKVRVNLPKFKVEAELDLNSTLKDLGMKEMFTNNANFSKMTHKGLIVDKVIQKAMIEVAENGTKAVATTNCFCGVACARLKEPEPIEFFCNRPFIFQIREKNTGANLFMGHVTKPPPPPLGPSDATSAAE